MKSKYSALLAIAMGMLSPAVHAEPITQPDKGTGRAAWMDEAKFGLFIHWGIYSELAKGEWEMSRSKIPVAEYTPIAKSFNPTKFNADEWVKVAKDAGMKYITITSKHHDGFCMFDTDVDDYNIVDGTPFKRDILMELKEACDKAGIKLGFYYSQTQDWYHIGGAGKKWDDAHKGGSLREYLDKVAVPQLKELLTKYDPAHIWFDTPYGVNAAVGRELEAVVRAIKPDTLINSRLMYHGYQVTKLTDEKLDELVDVGVDFLSYRDRSIPADSSWEYWETCMTLNDSWGYKEGDNNWKTPQRVVMQLVDIVSKGGAFLLNVGPTAEGVIPQESVEILATVGDWLEVNGESIYGAEITSLKGEAVDLKQSEAKRKALEKEAKATGAGKAKKGHKEKDYIWLATGREGKLYIHLFEWPNGSFTLSDIDSTVTQAYLLSDSEKKPLAFTQEGGVLTLTLPADAPDALNSVVCLEIQK